MLEVKVYKYFILLLLLLLLSSSSSSSLLLTDICIISVPVFTSADGHCDLPKGAHFAYPHPNTLQSSLCLMRLRTFLNIEAERGSEEVLVDPGSVKSHEFRATGIVPTDPGTRMRLKCAFILICFWFVPTVRGKRRRILLRDMEASGMVCAVPLTLNRLRFLT